MKTNDRRRSSGILLHVTSLPGPHGSGDLGKGARDFVDFLARTGQRWWQMLPIGPAGYGDSPYSAQSAFAGNPMFLDLAALGVEVELNVFPKDEVDYAGVSAYREHHLSRAFAAFGSAGKRERRAFEDFCERERRWLDDFALFVALKDAHRGIEWTRWAKPLRLRDPAAIRKARGDFADAIERAKFVQFRFDEQWSALRTYCREKGISLIGDLPIFLAHDSADVWQHRELFELDPQGLPLAVAGVPPDYFSSTGQRWGNPLYRWPRIARTGYRFWVDRFLAAFAKFDAVRLDHFIGFVRYWRIPRDEPTAIRGKWMRGPGRALFDRVARATTIQFQGRLPLIAEDLGLVTEQVTSLRRDLGLPGLRIVQFAFGTDPQADSFLPHNHERGAVAYTGTHDNDTAVGWFRSRGGKDDTRTAEDVAKERAAALRYMGKPLDADAEGEFPIHWEMIRLAMMSVADTAIFPIQDVLGLGSEARMNRPGQASGNWRYRLDPAALTAAIEKTLLEMTTTCGRAR